jgi:hypothetical protein
MITAEDVERYIVTHRYDIVSDVNRMGLTRLSNNGNNIFDELLKNNFQKVSFINDCLYLCKYLKLEHVIDDKYLHIAFLVLAQTVMGVEEDED